MFYRLSFRHRALRMSDTMDLGPSFSPEEDAFFSSGGNSAIPPDAGADTAGDTAKVDSAETPIADKADDKAVDKVEKMVSLSALHEERTKRQARDTELRTTREELANLKGKFSIIERLNAPTAEQVAAQAAAKLPPSPEEDIFGNVKHVGETVVQLQKRLDDADAATKAAETARTETEAFKTSYQADAAEFIKVTPDYMAAYNFLLHSRAADLKALGHDTPEALHNALTNDEIALAKFAQEKGKSPAAMIYAMAAGRGYKLAAAAKGGTAAERLETIEKGQAANKSLTDVGGEAPGGAMTAATLIAMPMDEFEAWTAKNPAKAKALMGG